MGCIESKSKLRQAALFAKPIPQSGKEILDAYKHRLWNTANIRDVLDQIYPDWSAGVDNTSHNTVVHYADIIRNHGDFWLVPSCTDLYSLVAECIIADGKQIKFRAARSSCPMQIAYEAHTH